MIRGKELVRELDKIEPLESSPPDGTVVKVKAINIDMCTNHQTGNTAGAALTSGS